MRNRLVMTLAALLLASAPLAQAQTPPTKPAPADVPSTGLFDFGFRGGSTDGDEARFERYRDLRPGATTLFDMKKFTDSYRFGAECLEHRLSGPELRGRLHQQQAVAERRVQLDSAQLPLRRAAQSGRATARGGSPWTQGRGRPFRGRPTLPADGSAVGVPCAPGSGPTSCNASTSAAAMANRSIYNNLIVRDDMQVRRDIVGGISEVRGDAVVQRRRRRPSTTSRTGDDAVERVVRVQQRRTSWPSRSTSATTS